MRRLKLSLSVFLTRFRQIGNRAAEAQKNSSTSIGFARAFARLAHAAAVTLRADSRRLPLAPGHSRDNRDWRRNAPHDVAVPVAPETFPRTPAVRACRFFDLAHRSISPEGIIVPPKVAIELEIRIRGLDW